MLVLKENTPNVGVGANYGLDIRRGVGSTQDNGYELCWKLLERDVGLHDVEWGLLNVGRGIRSYW